VNPERARPDLSKHAFTKQEITVASVTPEKPVSEEHKATHTRHDSLASLDSLESNPAQFSEDELDPFKAAANGLTKHKTKSSRRDRFASEGRHGSAPSKIMPMPCIIQI